MSVLGTHLSELIRRYAHELFSRQDAKRLLDRVAVEHPKVVEDVVPKLLPLYTVQRVPQNLLRERASIGDAVSILEALGEAGGCPRNPVLPTEYVRQSIRRAVVKPYLIRAGDLPAWFIDPPIEQRWNRPSNTANRTVAFHFHRNKFATSSIAFRHASNSQRRRLWRSPPAARAISRVNSVSRPRPTSFSWRTTKSRPVCACNRWAIFNSRLQKIRISADRFHV